MLAEAGRVVNATGGTRESYDTILSNKYFSRLWIVQEVLLARHVRIIIRGCTRSWISWINLYEQHVSLLSRSSWRRKSSPGALLLGKYFGHQSGTQPLHMRILDFSTKHCEDARDSLYGLMGIVAVSDHVAIDYTKSVLDVYVEVLEVFNRNFQQSNSIKSSSELIKAAITLADHWNLINEELMHFLNEAFMFRPKPYVVKQLGLHRKAESTDDDAYQGGLTMSQGRWWYELSNGITSEQIYPCGGAYHDLYSDE